MQLTSSSGRYHYIHHHHHHQNQYSASNSISSPVTSLVFDKDHFVRSIARRRNAIYGTKRCRIVASSNVSAAPFWDAWKPQKGSASPSLSDILWPSAGTFYYLMFNANVFPNANYISLSELLILSL